MRLPSEPVKQTCPQINENQKILVQAIRDIDFFCKRDDKEDYEDIISFLSDLRWELNSLDSALEDLRASNSALRDWGNELTSICENLEAEKDQEIDDLTNKINDLEYEIKHYESI